MTHPARRILLLLATALLSAPALAWVPRLEETTAKNVIDGAYGRREPVATYLTVDLNVKEGQFVSGVGAVKAFDGGEKCLTDWLAAPQDYSAGSRPVEITASGQADQLYWQAQTARNKFQNLSVAQALTPQAAAERLPDGELRIDVFVRGLPTEKARDAYAARLRGANGELLAPSRVSFVNDFKQEGGVWSGTLVYYFEPLKAGLGASDKVELLLRTEADTDCAYSVPLDLSRFQ